MAEKVRPRYKPDRVLENWKEMMEALPYMNETELKHSLDHELHGERRQDFIMRLHRRFNKLRGKRELAEYLNQEQPPADEEDDDG